MFNFVFLLEGGWDCDGKGVQGKGKLTCGVSWGQGKEELRDLKPREKQQETRGSRDMRKKPNDEIKSQEEARLPSGDSKAHGRQVEELLEQT